MQKATNCTTRIEMGNAATTHRTSKLNHRLDLLCATILLAGEIYLFHVFLIVGDARLHCGVIGSLHCTIRLAGSGSISSEGETSLAGQALKCTLLGAADVELSQHHIEGEEEVGEGDGEEGEGRGTTRRSQGGWVGGLDGVEHSQVSKRTKTA